MFYTFSKSSQKLLCYIFMQQKSPQAPIQTDTEYWSLNLIHAPMNKWHDSVSTRFLAPYPSLNSRISHPSSLSVSLCTYCFSCFSVPNDRDYMHSISSAKPYYCLPVFTNVFSAEREEAFHQSLCWVSR